MKNTLRFHDGSLQLCSDSLVRHLRSRGAQSLHEIISHICPEYLKFPGTKRILLWSTVRNFLEKMERAGLIVRVEGEQHAAWQAAECAKIVRPSVHGGDIESVVREDESAAPGAAVG